MLSKTSLDKEIGNLSVIMQEVELAIAFEDDSATKNKLASALGQLKAARLWLIKIQRENAWT